MAGTMNKKTMKIDLAANILAKEQSHYFMQDFDPVANEPFIRKVFVPYFKDIFSDLSEKSDAKNEYITKYVMMNYCELPGIINERIFQVMDRENKEQV